MPKIELTQGKYAVVDECDLDVISGYSWSASAYTMPNGKVLWYAVSNQKQPDGSYRHLKMHRLILGTGGASFVDHVNGDGLNNTRQNLRLATPSQNQFNAGKRLMKAGKPSTSRFKGVHKSRTDKKWVASIRFEGRLYHIGVFLVEEDAARAYDERAKALFGEFARLNF